jgi:hypothetical protein
MLIGLDFDNTIVNYSDAIVRLARERFDLPKDLPVNKVNLRDLLRSEGREGEWTEFQGELYGPGMRYAEPYPGALDTMRDLKACGHRLVIISHRTKLPYAGHPYDLHASAMEWVIARLSSQGHLSKDAVYFLETRADKIGMIASLNCDVFLDDLPEVFNDPSFPTSTRAILFDPDYRNADFLVNHRIRSWKQLPSQLS